MKTLFRLIWLNFFFNSNIANVDIIAKILLLYIFVKEGKKNYRYIIL